MISGAPARRITRTLNGGKCDRREDSKGYAHLKRLHGKTYGAVRKAEWFQPYRLRRDIAAGALRIVEGRERKAS
jgi:hypothetical protein